MRGWIYIITSKAYPELLKIGFTTRIPDIRAHELFNAGALHEFDVEYEALVINPRHLEKEVHKELSIYHEKKEWFQCSISQAALVIKKLAGNNLLYESHRKKLAAADKKHKLIKFTSEANTTNHLFTKLKNNSDIEKISELNLCAGNIIEIPEEVCELKNLKALYFAENKITKLPEKIGSLVNLESIAGGGNNITELPKSICLLKNIRFIYLQKNYIKNIPANIGDLKNLEVLSLFSNSITEIPESIGYAENLSKLWLTGNKISSLPESFSNLQNLEELFLGFNNFETIPDCIFNLKKLRKIDISNNLIKNKSLYKKLKFINRD